MAARAWLADVVCRGDLVAAWPRTDRPLQLSTEIEAAVREEDGDKRVA